MTMVIHPQRVAWDGARAFVRAVPSVWCGWLADQLGGLLGGEYRQHVIESRTRLATSKLPQAVDIEAGIWRARIDDVLRSHPEQTAPLAALVQATTDRLRGWH